ncbi:MAG: HK97 gp10 family phage protein [Methanobrevibacter sp.]|nr:HK97 gp10 family phage protein [Methanosphaera sp.]MBR0369151.1 HK97 gp10 family phage protein [Methanobrevibacter sp.]
MGVNVSLTFNDSFYKKLDTNSITEAITDTVNDVTEAAVSECQSECPVRTGNLRDSHYTEIDDYTGSILNTAEYWIYVVYGTYKMSANNYPSRAWNNMLSQNTIGNLFHENLIKHGVDVE